MLALHPHLSGNTLNSWRELTGKIYNPEAGKHRCRVLIPPAYGLPAVTICGPLEADPGAASASRARGSGTRTHVVSLMS